MDDSIRTALDLGGRNKPWLSAREWRLHGGLFLLTVLTTILAGVMLAAPELPIAEPRLASPLDYLLYIPLSYLYSINELLRYAISQPHALVEGATKTETKHAKHNTHEKGHYL